MLYWINKNYSIIHVNVDDVKEEEIIDSCKQMINENLTYINTTVKKWNPGTDDVTYGRISGSTKYIVILQAIDDLTKVGPVWSNINPENMLNKTVIHAHLSISER